MVLEREREKKTVIVNCRNIHNDFSYSRNSGEFSSLVLLVVLVNFFFFYKLPKVFFEWINWCYILDFAYDAVFWGIE